MECFKKRGVFRHELTLINTVFSHREHRGFGQICVLNAVFTPNMICASDSHFVQPPFDYSRKLTTREGKSNCVALPSFAGTGRNEDCLAIDY
jgi:hypothetical protein